MTQRRGGAWHVTHNLASFLEAIIWISKCFQIPVFTEYYSSGFLALRWKKWEDVRNEALNKLVTRVAMAGAVSPAFFGTRTGRTLDCIAESTSVSGRCRHTDFTGTAAFLLCNENTEDGKWKREH